MSDRTPDQIREEILALVREYHDASRGGGFVPRESPVPVSRRLYDED